MFPQTYRLRADRFSGTVMGGIDENFTVMFKGIVFRSFGTGVFSGAASDGTEEDGRAGDGESGSVSRGGVFSGDRDSSSEEEELPAPKNSFSLPVTKYYFNESTERNDYRTCNGVILDLSKGNRVRHGHKSRF